MRRRARLVNRLLLPVLLTSLWLLSRNAAAQVAPNVTAQPAPKRRLSLTIFPFQIAMPLARMGSIYPVELTGEVRLTDKVGLALLAGGGRSSHASGGVDGAALAALAGIEGRYYVTGDFSGGFSVGWQLYWWDLFRISGVPPAPYDSGAENRGLTSGGLVGYKHVWPVGFTIDGQFGYGFIVYTKGDVFDEPSKTVLISLKAGWSF